MGGSHSLQCNEMARKMWLWAYHRNRWLSAAHIPGVQNVEADRESRVFSTNTEWMLNPGMFKRMFSECTLKPTIDLFASRINARIPRFVSWRSEPQCVAVDAFSIQWGNEVFYAFLPFD